MLYEIKVDNNQDGVEDVTLRVPLQDRDSPPWRLHRTRRRHRGIPPITALDGPGSEGLGLRQTYTVTAGRGNERVDLNGGRTLFAVPSNVGPRTMPDYPAALRAGHLRPWRRRPGVRGHGRRSFLHRPGRGVRLAQLPADGRRRRAEPGRRTPTTRQLRPRRRLRLQRQHHRHRGSDRLLTRSGTHPAAERLATIGTYGTTSRPRDHGPRRRRAAARARPLPAGPAHGQPADQRADHRHRIEGPLQHGRPENDAQFATFFLDPLLATSSRSLGIPGPAATAHRPAAPGAPTRPDRSGRTPGPIADLLRTQHGHAASAAGAQKRLGLLTLLDGDPTNDDAAGFPNGRRPTDDVTDIAARAVAGHPGRPRGFGTRIGDGVNTNDMPARATFPFVNPSHDGRNSRHVHSGEPGCAGVCPPGSRPFHRRHGDEHLQY